MADSASVELSIPRLAGRQTTRNNVSASSVSEYFRRSVWYPYLDCTLQALRDKFSVHHITVLKLTALVPSLALSYNWPDVVDCYQMYQSELSSAEEVRHEYEQWRSICANMPERDRPSSPLHALDIVPPRLRNIQILLHIFCTLPVTTCTPERAFSALKLLKNYLRNSMSDDRLTGLALMYIHPDIDIDVSDVVRRFMTMPAKIKPSSTKKRLADDAGENTAAEADPDRRRRIDT